MQPLFVETSGELLNFFALDLKSIVDHYYLFRIKINTPPYIHI